MAGPTTPFEDATGTDPAWTTLVEEATFLSTVVSGSGRVTKITLGQSAVDSNPMDLYAVGYPEPPTEAELRSKSNILILAMQHGNEPSGRDAALQYLRDLAYTTDVDTLKYLKSHPVMFIPTANPDGFPNSRENGNGVDLNRQWLSYSQAENQAIGKALRDYHPHILLDAHEMFDRTYQFEFLHPENPAIHPDIMSSAQSLRDALMADATAGGYTNGLYPRDDQERVMSVNGCLQNIITILIEASGQSINSTLTRKDAVSAQVSLYGAAVSWHRENLPLVKSSVAAGRLGGLSDGENQVAIERPSITSPPLGYRLTSAQFSSVQTSLDRMQLLSYPVDSSTDVYVPMAQANKRLLVNVVDSRASYNIVSATAENVPPSLTSVGRVVNVKWRKQGGVVVGAQTAVNADSLNVLSLDPATNYEWSVQNQEASSTSDWSAWQTLTTAAQFNVEYRDVSTQDTTTVLGVSGTSLDVADLASGEQYEFRVQEDNNLLTSAWSFWHQFTTVSSGDLVSTVHQAQAAAAWLAQVDAPVALKSGAVASDQENSIASVNLSIVESAQATDATGDLSGAVGAMSSAATGNDTVDALASAAAAISAGAAAGESWTVQAQVVVNLVEQGAAADEIRRQTDDAVTAALEAQSLAADQFIAALDTIASLSDSASVTDAYQAVVLQLASIAAGAVASDSFRMLFGLQRAIQEAALADASFSISYAFVNALRSGGLSGDAWALMANLNASLSDICSVTDLMSVRASTTARLTAGAIASSRFAIVNAGVRYLVMGAVILRDALQYRVNTKPALNQSVKIKPGH